MVCVLVAVGTVPAQALAQTPTPGPPITVDGPDGDIIGLTGMSIARDGTGGLVYLRYVGGVPHVFVSRLVGGVWQPPEQVDFGFAGPSSQPVIAAGNGGTLLVAFINSGALYVVDRLSATSNYHAPQLISGGASNPSIQMSNLGKAYLAFAAASGGGSNIRVAYYYNGQWQVVAAPLNAAPGDDAGTGAGRPVVATAGDGIATVAWGEEGHIFSRRVWYTSPSIVFEQADVPYYFGWTELSSSQPYAAVGGNSSYVDVVFVETLGAGSSQQSRVLFNQLRGSQYQGVIGNDGLTTPGSDQATDPRVAMDEFGNGLSTSYQVGSNQVWSSVLTENGFWYAMYRADSLPNASAPYPVTSAVGLYTLVVAWQHDPGPLLAPDIRARYFTASNGYGPEQQLSSAGQGANAAEGLATGGDQNGDVAVAWVQGSGPSSAIKVASLYQPPSPPQPLNSVSYTRNSRPTLQWTPPNNSWGPFTYTVTVGGATVGRTTATSFNLTSSLAQGGHNWTVVARNPAGQASTVGTSRILVDKQPPSVRVKVSGPSGARVALNIRYTDRPVGRASGVGSIVIRWGDGRSSSIPAGAHATGHVYRRSKSYTIKVIVTDRAGNRTTVVKRVVVGGAGTTAKGPNVPAPPRSTRPTATPGRLQPRLSSRLSP